MAIVGFVKRNLLWAMGAVAIASVLAISFVTWRWADDFSLSLDLEKTDTVFQHMWHTYTHWDGRSLCPHAFVQLMLIKHAPPLLTVFLWALSFVSCALAAASILFREVGRPGLFPAKRTALVALIMSVLWFGMGSYISETVYWVTGGAYSFSNLMGLVWVYCLVRIRDTAEPRRAGRTALLLFLFGFAEGMSGHNLGPGLLTLLLLTWCQDRLLSRGGRDVPYLAGALGLTGGMVIVFLAPGNFVRAAYGQHSFVMAPRQLLHNYCQVLANYLHWSVILVILSVAAAWIISCVVPPDGSGLDRREARGGPAGHVVGRLLGVLKYLAAALATVVPFAMVPDFAPRRSSIFFMTFLSLFVMISTFRLSHLLFERVRFLSSLRPVAPFLLAAFLVAQTAAALLQVRDALPVRVRILEREALLERPELKGTDVVLPPLKTGPIPFSLRFNDLNEDPNHWINLAVAKFYGLKSVRLEKPARESGRR